MYIYVVIVWDFIFDLKYQKRSHRPGRRHASASLLSTHGLCPTHTVYIGSVRRETGHTNTQEEQHTARQEHHYKRPH